MPPNKENNPGSPVMDIQRPNQPTVIKPSGSLNRPATMEYTRPRLDSTQMPSLTPVPAPSEPAPQPIVSKPKRSKKPLVVLLLVLLLAAGGGGAYYYFMILNKDVAPAVTQQPEPEAPKEDADAVSATPEGVDEVTRQIDESMNSVNDTEDFKPDDVSDDALGL